MKAPSMTAKVEIEISARYLGVEYPIIDGSVDIPIRFELAPLDSEAVRATIDSNGANEALADALILAATELRANL